MNYKNALLALPLALAATTSVAEDRPMPCLDRTVMIDVLTKNHGEVQTGLGLQKDNAVFEVYTSPESGSWTLLMTQTTGVTCIIAAGTNWLELDVQPVAGVPG